MAEPLAAERGPGDLVQQRSLVRRTREVVGRRASEPLPLRRLELREGRALAPVAAQQPTTEGPVDREPHAPIAEEGPARDPVRSAMVGGHLDDRDGPEAARGVDRERSGVVVRVAALVRLGEHDVDRPPPEEVGDPTGDRDEVQGALLIGDPQAHDAIGRDADLRERGFGLGPSDPGVARDVAAVGGGVAAVPGGTVGDVDEPRVPQAGELASRAHDLVVGVGDDHRDPRRRARAPREPGQERFGARRIVPHEKCV